MRKVVVSLLIVNYKSKNEIRACLKTIKTRLTYEVIITDNDKNNVGYGAGINKAAKKARGEYLFILNPDTLLSPFAIDKLVAFYKSKPKCGIVAPDLTDENGNLYEFVGTGKLTPFSGIFSLSFINKFFPNNPVSRRYWIRRNVKDEYKKVDVAPGTAFLIKRELFFEVGCFDEKYFLYFEEADLCKRIRELGYLIFIVQGVKIVHLWGESTKKFKDKYKVFKESRYYYFRKNYGLLKALFVNFILDFGKSELIFLMILVLAAFLRFYRVTENLDFHGELGDNYLVIKNTIGRGVIPLLGPPTSHSWLSFGPLFYYLFAPFLILNHYNPVTGAYFFGIISIIGLVANYYVVKKFFSAKVSLISSYLITISPTWIDIARQSRFFSMVTYLFYPFLLLTVMTYENIKYMFWLGLILGIMINFHLTPIFLMPSLVLIFFLKRRNIKRKDVGLALLGFTIPNIPFLIYNIKNHFEMITKFAVWIPYRSAIYHNFNLGFTLGEIINFLGGWVFLIPIFLAIYLERRNKYVRILSLFLVFGIVALILHKDPPTHYFYVLYPIPVIFLSIFFSKFKSFLILAVLIFLTVVNFSYLFSDKWFYINENVVKQNYNIPYKLQLEVARKIVNDSDGRPYNLHRVGFSDQFEGEYAQNYRYLLWLYGNEPKDYKTNLSYKIVEYPNMEIIKEY